MGLQAINFNLNFFFQENDSVVIPLWKMKELDFLFLLAVICFISTILVIISFFSCYFKQRTAPQLNIANINHQSIDSGFGKLNQFFEFKLLHFILYNCFIFLDE